MDNEIKSVSKSTQPHKFFDIFLENDLEHNKSS
jgi:hypothetical protein